MKKITVLTAFILVLATLLTACSFGPYDDLHLTVEDLEITLDSSFKEFEQQGVTAVYGSNDVMAFFLREPFELFKTEKTDGSEMSLKEYAEKVLENNGLKAAVTEEDGLVSFTYNNSAKGKDFFYKAFVFKGSSCYWLVQFSVKASKAADYTDLFNTYAKSVIVK